MYNNGLHVHTPSFPCKNSAHTNNIKKKSVYENVNLNRNHFLKDHEGVSEHYLKIRKRANSSQAVVMESP